ncbi:uncharacterized protein LOC112112904, partial [Terrapene carolina triunguis]|uniref:uncharacterized protein LOC112112904 n=1 Tax=Terrapene triunguis TaxID=2587831 RepID=UPI001156BA73
MGAPVTPACLLLLLHLTAGTSAEPHYVVVSPAVFYHPHTGTVSVHLSDLNETVRVSVRLERGDGPSAITLLEREVQEPRLHENVRFQVSPHPQPSARPRALAMGTEPVSPGSAAQPQAPGTAGLRGLAMGTELVTQWAAVATELEPIPQQRQAGGSGDGVGDRRLRLFSSPCPPLGPTVEAEPGGSRPFPPEALLSCARRRRRARATC